MARGVRSIEIITPDDDNGDELDLDEDELVSAETGHRSIPGSRRPGSATTSSALTRQEGPISMAILHAGARRLLKPAINFDSDGNEVKVEADTEIIIINAGLPILASKFRNNDRQYGLLDRRFVVTYEGPTTTRSGRKAKDFDVQVGRAFHRVTYAEMAPKQEPPF